MFYTLPPVPPTIAHVEIAPAQGAAILVAEDCKRGSRDCFPEDRVGYGAVDIWMTTLRPWALDNSPNR